MNISSILIVASSSKLPQIVESLNLLDALEVYHIDSESGKIVAVLEADSVDEEVARLESIKTLPGVLYAEMVCHYFDSTTSVVESLKSETSPDVDYPI